MIEQTVRETKERSGWSASRTLALLGVPRSTYYNLLTNAGNGKLPERRRNAYSLLPVERRAIIDYALAHPDLRHRELAWRMVDEDIAYVSPSAVYHVLLGAALVCRWDKAEITRTVPARAAKPDEKWQTDIRYVKVLERTYFLIVFIDEWSRYIVYWELMLFMDRNAVSLAAQSAVETLPSGVTPIIQSDNGSGYISGDFSRVLGERGISHHRIRPHTPTDNAIVERAHRTIKEKTEENELSDLDTARRIISHVVDWYNTERLHSSLHFLRPVDYYRGNPDKLLEERREKLAKARHERKEENLRIRQRTLPLDTSPPARTNPANRNLFQSGFCPSFS